MPLRPLTKKFLYLAYRSPNSEQTPSIRTSQVADRSSGRCAPGSLQRAESWLCERVGPCVGRRTAINPEDGRSSEEWARAAWEDAPAPLRWFMVAGWRFVLGLHLGPRSSPDHILGWQIFERDPNTTACQLHSGFLAAVNIFHRAEGRFIWSTFVTYDRPIARVIWLPVSVIHRLLARLALRRVANSRRFRLCSGVLHRSPRAN